ncbi:MAG: cation-translocating P-type ATPase [Bacteroidota bacterium]
MNEEKKDRKLPFTISIDESFHEYDTSKEGLKDREVKERRKKYGLNKLEKKKEKSLFRLFLDQLNNPVIYLLLAAVVISFIFKDIPEAIAILIVIILNTVIGFWMEYQARTSMKALRELDKLKANVKRNGETREIDAENLVPGDIIVLESGDVVPADARVTFTAELEVDESPLTGESLPVEKKDEVLEEDTPLADRVNMLHKGTALVSGKATAVVTATGKDTEIGQISQMVSEEEKESIPLNRKLRKLSHNLIWIILGLATIFFVLGWLTGKEAYLMIQTAIAWTVAAIPEGLAIVASIALARGMLRLSRKNVIVKKLAAVETLGETTVIFTDKTGTLTLNKLTVSNFEYPGHKFEISDDDSREDIRKAVKKMSEHENFQHIRKISIFCNDAEHKGEKGYTGDPLDVSLMEFFSSNEKEKANELLEKERIHEDPFDSDSKFMGSINHEDDQLYVSCKGAAEPVLPKSVKYLEEGKEKEITDDFRKEWIDKNEELSGKGLKVIACSYRLEDKSKEDELKKKDEFVGNMIFVGYVCFIDPARKEIYKSIEKCHAAGIKVVMVTGDHPGTAENIAEKVHLTEESNEIDVLKGKELEENPDEIYGTDLFARVDPRQKNEIVDHFMNQGEVTAMTGDGVNDAPALKKANIGIAMGKRGTQIAQEVADMVLKDDSFSSIVDAIQQGRVIFGNIRRFVVYQLSYHLAEIIIIAGISFSLFKLPLLPLQLLFLNLLSDVFPALALGLGRGDESIMKQKPKDPEEPIINKRNWLAMVIYGSVMAVIITASYLLVIFYFDKSHEFANTVAFFGLAFSQLLHVFNMKEPQEHLFKNQVTENKYIWIALAISFAALFAAYFIPVLHENLSFTHLPLKFWGIAAGTSLLVVVVIQIIKRVFRI